MPHSVRETVSDATGLNRRILIVDDNPAIHEDFAKVLRRSGSSTTLEAAEVSLFGDTTGESAAKLYQLDSAFQGEQGLALVRRSLAEGCPYAVAFIDVRMPPGWDGIETVARIWEVDPAIQIVLCTAYSDYSWEQILAKLGRSDRLVILKKPFDNIEVQQLADTLTLKWQRTHEGNRHLGALQNLIRTRSHSLSGLDESWEIDTRQLELAAEVASTHVRHRLVLEHDLRDAIENTELTVHYQPLIEIDTQSIVSLEALVRWRHREKGWISPADFVPLAEESGLIFALGEFVLRTVCRQMVAWERDGVSVVPVAVNISALQLKRRDLIDTVRESLREAGLAPDQLALELTESALIENLGEHNDTLESLRSDGISIEIDDFGTGYSSLSYLKHLPVNAVKIDRSFVGQIDTNPADAAIVGAIIEMAHSLGLKVIAEGVETVGQLDALARHRCDIAQGFFFARPLFPGDCKRLLQAAARRLTFTDTMRLLAHEYPIAGLSECA